MEGLSLNNNINNQRYSMRLSAIVEADRATTTLMVGETFQQFCKRVTIITYPELIDEAYRHLYACFRLRGAYKKLYEMVRRVDSCGWVSGSTPNSPHEILIQLPQNIFSRHIKAVWIDTNSITLAALNHIRKLVAALHTLAEQCPQCVEDIVTIRTPADGVRITSDNYENLQAYCKQHAIMESSPFSQLSGGSRWSSYECLGNIDQNDTFIIFCDSLIAQQFSVGSCVIVPKPQNLSDDDVKEMFRRSKQIITYKVLRDKLKKYKMTQRSVKRLGR